MADTAARATARQREIVAALRDRVDTRTLELINEWRLTKLPAHRERHIDALRLQAVIEVLGERIARLEDEVRQLRSGS